MNFLELVKKRYSVREYDFNKPIEEDKLNYILECARRAPSAVNFQPWTFYILKSENSKNLLQQCYNREWIKSAPIYILVCTDESKAWVRKFDNKNHADIDAAIAIEHICLAATEQGLGTCWVCNFDYNLLKEVFKLPKSVKPIAIIPLGYISEPPKKISDRKSIEEIVIHQY